MSPTVITIIVISVIVLFIIIAIYNTLVRLKNLVKDSWSGVDTELKRRHALIPNLVSTVKGYAQYEKSVLENVVKLRSKILSSHANPKERGDMESEMSRNLKSLFAVVEKYPDLKASAHFMQLQQELVRTEDRIQSARRFYNGNVRDYNIRVQSVPSNIIASIGGFKRHDFFEIENASERQNVDVNLGIGGR